MLSSPEPFPLFLITTSYLIGLRDPDIWICLISALYKRRVQQCTVAQRIPRALRVPDFLYGNTVVLCDVFDRRSIHCGVWRLHSVRPPMKVKVRCIWSGWIRIARASPYATLTAARSCINVSSAREEDDECRSQHRIIFSPRYLLNPEYRRPHIEDLQTILSIRSELPWRSNERIVVRWKLQKKLVLQII